MLLQNKDVHCCAFTPAEVLIALVIIGIIAAITVPVFYANYQKEVLHTAFKKTYSDLNKAAKMFYVENGISICEYAESHTISNTLEKIMSLFSMETSVSNRKWSTDPSEYNDIDNTYKLKALSGYVIDYNICDVTSTKADLSGRLFSLNDRPSSGENGPIVCVDTNGLKNPNKYGNDFFLFIFTTDNTVIPMGMNHKNNTANTDVAKNFFLSGETYCKKKGNSSLYGLTCAYYALADKHPSNSNKSYWKDFL